jgi:glutamyl-tRNA reductase
MPAEGTILVVGVSHHTAALAAREQLALDAGGARGLLRDLRARPGVGEAVVLSTCNRTEIYAVASTAEQGERAVRAALLRTTSLGAATLSCAAYALFDEDAVEHLFRVAAGLESAILGETEIGGQVRAALRRAEQEAAAGPVLAGAFTRALAAAARVRRRTGISVGATSICSVVAELAAGRAGDRGRPRVVLVGAGGLAHSLAGALAAVAGTGLTVLNRTEAAARAIAERHGVEAASLAGLDETLAAADVVVSATTAPHAVISSDAVRRAVAARARPLTIVDLAVPRDVDPAAAALDGVVLHDIDAVQERVRRNVEVRRREARAAGELIRREARCFDAWRRERDATSALRAVWQQAEEVRRATLEGIDGDVGDAERERLDRITAALVRRLLHGPSERLRAAAATPAAAAHLATFRLLFDVPAADDAAEGADVVALPRRDRAA